MYRAVTRDIEVEVEPFYLEERSEPSERRYVWGYRITIENRSDEAVQLLSRYWHITDGDGRVEEVRGNRQLLDAKIPSALWEELKAEGLMRKDAPTG